MEESLGSQGSVNRGPESNVEPDHFIGIFSPSEQRRIYDCTWIANFSMLRIKLTNKEFSAVKNVGGSEKTCN